MREILNYVPDSVGTFKTMLEKTGWEAGTIFEHGVLAPNMVPNYSVVIGNPLNLNGKDFFETIPGSSSEPSKLLYKEGQLFEAICLKEAEEFAALIKKRY